MSAMFVSSTIAFKVQTMRSNGAVQARKVVHSSTRTTPGLTIKTHTVLNRTSLPNIKQLVNSKVIPTPGLCIKCPLRKVIPTRGLRIKCPLRPPTPDGSPSILDAQPFAPRLVEHLSVAEDNIPETPAAVAEDDTEPTQEEVHRLLPADLLRMLDE